MTIWFDVDDLIRFFQNSARPTGIQRYSFETCAAMARLSAPEDDIRFCRRDGSGFRPIHFPALEAGIRVLAEGPVYAAAPVSAVERRWPGWLVRIALHISPETRRPFGQLARAGRSFLGALAALARLAASRCRRKSAPHLGGHGFDLGSNPIAFAAGDWLVNLGASWERPYRPAILSQFEHYGVRLAFLAHDLIPALYPEWCTQSMVRDFSAWLDGAVPRAALMLAVSENTKYDLQAVLGQRGHQAPACVKLPAGGTVPAMIPLPPMLGEPYVLMVGTIEARKNHAGMFRLWRRLLQEMPRAQVPTLVFAGKAGWLTADLMQQLENAAWLDGKIRFIDRPSDSTLASLYQHCLFSLFPSFYEGWGLPVSESLSFGVPVAASHRAAIPEAGGKFCAWFDPDDLNSIAAIIGGLIRDPFRLAQMRASIAAEYRPLRWDDTARELRAALGLLPGNTEICPQTSYSRQHNKLPAPPRPA